MPIQFNQAPARRAASITFGCFLPPALTPRDGVVGELLGELLNQYLFERLRLCERKSILDPVDIERVRWKLASVRGGAIREQRRRRSRPVFDAWKLGWSPAMLDDVPGHLATVTASRSGGGASHLPRQRGGFADGRRRHVLIQ